MASGPMAASTGRTEDCTRPHASSPYQPLQCGSHPQKTFLQFHEAGHKEIPHQRGLYKFIQDCTKHLKPEVADLFEREANMFASVVLFQNDGFAKMTADFEFGIKVPMSHARKFGASLYAGIREYVRHSTCACVVIIFEPTEICPEHGMKAPVRRMELSEEYRRRFGALVLPEAIVPGHQLMSCIPIGNRKMSSPQSFDLIDRNGERHEFVGEGFKTPYNTFVLIHCVASLKASLLISA